MDRRVSHKVQKRWLDFECNFEDTSNNCKETQKRDWKDFPRKMLKFSKKLYFAREQINFEIYNGRSEERRTLETCVKKICREKVGY